MSLSRKFVVWIVLFALVVGSLAAYGYYLVERSEEEEKLSLLGAVTSKALVGSLDRMMLSGETEIVREILHDMEAQDAISGIQLINREGLVKASTDRSREGKQLHRSDAGCRECHEQGKEQRGFLLPEQDLFRWAEPIRNKPACHACHSPEFKNNGILIVDFSIQPFKRHLRADAWRGISISSAALFIFIVVFLGLARVLVVRKLAFMGDAMREFQGGNFESRIAVSGGDEIAELGAGFNNMAEAVSAKNREKDDLLGRLGNANEGLQREMAERIRMENALREQMAFLQTVIDGIPVPVFYKDRRGVYLGCNQAFLDFLGFTPARIIGKTVHDIAPKELADKYHRMDEELFTTGGIQIYEFGVKHVDGTTHEVMFHKATYTDADGNAAGLIGAMLDITERKQAADALTRTNEALQALIQASPLAIMAFDRQGNVRIWNPAAERIFGWTEAETLGRFNPIVPEDRKDEFWSLLERVLSGETLTKVELVRRRKDGALIDVSVSSAAVSHLAGGPGGIMSVIEDITDRKKAQEQLKRTYDTQTAINWILNISLKDVPLEGVLKQSLDLILSLPWLSFEARGSIYLTEGEPAQLVIRAQRGLSGLHQENCRIVPYGTCLCGRAAASGEVQFAGTIDERHEIRYEGITPHGHYCVPIKSGQTVLGVINIYLKEGHRRDEREVDFLNAFASALAGVVRRKRTEAAMRESEKRYRTLAEAAHDVIFIVDRQGSVRYVNSYGAELFRRSTQELIGKPVGEIFPRDVSDRQRMNMGKVFETGESVYVENPYNFPDRASWLGTWLVALKDEAGSVESVLGVSRDITERRQAEEEREKLIADLRTALDSVSRSQKEWRDTFDSITDEIAIIDREFNIVRANRAFSENRGLHPQDAVNRKCYEVVHGSDTAVSNCPHSRTLQENAPFIEEVLEPKTKRVYLVSTFPYRSPAGDLIGSIHVARDITEQREAETRLIMSERLASLGQMASGIAHEINNPLASIAGCSEGLLTRVKKGQCETKLFETYLNIIIEEVFRCKSITTSMLSFVRKTTYEKKDIDINGMLDRALEIIGFQGRLKELELRKEYAELPTVRGNEGELRQVFLAIVTNALDAMENRGVLTLRTGVKDGRVTVGITDSGPGIPADVLPKIFDPFFTMKADKGGTGLGLSIARKIILNHNGTIEVSSEPGMGATFMISLPV